MRQQLRLVVIAVGCLIGGCTLIFRSFAGVPRFEDLTEVSGVVKLDTDSTWTRGGAIRYPVLIVDSSPVRYKYLDWFPRVKEVLTAIHAGDRITLWTDSKNNWVWQIENDGRRVVSYAEVRAAVVSNGRFDVPLGIAVLALSGLSWRSLYRNYGSHR